MSSICIWWINCLFKFIGFWYHMKVRQKKRNLRLASILKGQHVKWTDLTHLYVYYYCYVYMMWDSNFFLSLTHSCKMVLFLYPSIWYHVIIRDKKRNMRLLRDLGFYLKMSTWLIGWCNTLMSIIICVYFIIWDSSLFLSLTI